MDAVCVCMQHAEGRARLPQLASPPRVCVYMYHLAPKSINQSRTHTHRHITKPHTHPHTLKHRAGVQRAETLPGHHHLRTAPPDVGKCVREYMGGKREKREGVGDGAKRCLMRYVHVGEGLLFDCPDASRRREARAYAYWMDRWMDGWMDKCMDGFRAAPSSSLPPNHNHPHTPSLISSSHPTPLHNTNELQTTNRWAGTIPDDPPTPQPSLSHIHTHPHSTTNHKRQTGGRAGAIPDGPPTLPLTHTPLYLYIGKQASYTHIHTRSNPHSTHKCQTGGRAGAIPDGTIPLLLRRPPHARTAAHGGVHGVCASRSVCCPYFLPSFSSAFLLSLSLSVYVGGVGWVQPITHHHQTHTPTTPLHHTAPPSQTNYSPPTNNITPLYHHTRAIIPDELLTTNKQHHPTLPPHTGHHPKPLTHDHHHTTPPSKRPSSKSVRGSIASSRNGS
jgi:hypothetical protein